MYRRMSRMTKVCRRISARRGAREKVQRRLRKPCFQFVAFSYGPELVVKVVFEGEAFARGWFSFAVRVCVGAGVGP